MPTTINGYNEAAGAGRIDYNRFQSDYGFFSKNLTYKATLGSQFYTETHTYYAGETLTVCLSWLAYANGTASDTRFTNYFFLIRNSSGQTVHYAQCNYNNTIFMRLPITYDDRYTIEVYRDMNGNILVNPRGEYVALDFRID